MNRVMFSDVQMPTTWTCTDFGAIEFKTNDDARKAEALFKELQAEITRLKASHPEAESPNDGGITQALVAMARANAIEECARVCDEIRADRNKQSDDDAAVGALMCLEGIRAIDAPLPQKDK